MNKFFLIFFNLWMVLFIFSALWTEPVFASICKVYHQEKVCILDIRRSAKYYWQFRVKTSVNGKKKPLTVYDCRERLKVLKNGSTVRFSDDGIENYICETLKHF